MSVRVKRSIAFVVRNPADDGSILAVRRPPDDEDLPDAWGLPAGSLRPGESWHDAVRRAGREKLGVELEVGEQVNEGKLTRGDPGADGHVLHMRLYEARVVEGTPAVPQPHDDVTQYAAWRWDRPDSLRPAAERGSLCSSLFLASSR